MGDKTGIEWADSTWNPITGCDKVSPGCDRCYAETFAERWRGTPEHYFANGFDVQLRPNKLDLPLRWTKPRKVFVNSMSDLFHDKVPDEYIAKVWAVMAAAPRHTFQVLTKRHARMRSLLNNGTFFETVADYALEFDRDIWRRWQAAQNAWPLPNVWLGVSAEDQKRADLRIPALLDTPAAVRFVSAEPLLGPIELIEHFGSAPAVGGTAALDWVIVGGESGPGARPMHPDWARSMRDQCVAAGVPFLFKQWGEFRPVLPSDGDVTPDRYVQCETGRSVDDDGMWNASGGHWCAMRRLGKKRAGRELDGRTWDQYPESAVS
ncbi:bacteriophage protein gp37 [Mycobacteroides abscessus subsp. bolletii]|uniref:DUF5131 family protein n=1 Tax=Mycobacteroides abscessus TaxID=36809 RepID=UPI0009A6B87A|nr:phage Gp37/Gp68 family protein [Mycobacteroides abscessus]SLD51107.1 bacteriophage protein gp37 [Mycobacteroides abscessus subsp. bolletii]